MKKGLWIVVLVILTSVSALTGCNNNHKESNRKDQKAAKVVADEYCDLIKSKQAGLISISYTGNSSSNGNIFYFDYDLEYDTLTQVGTAKIEKDSSGKFKAVRMDFN